MDPAECRRVLDELAARLRGYDDRVPMEAELVGLLGTFGSSEDRCFEHCVFALINHYANPRVGQAARLDLALRAILDRGRPGAALYGHTVRYAALYGRCMMARRNFARRTYRELLAEHEDWASKRPGTAGGRGTFLHLQAMMHALEQDRAALDRALSCARRASSRALPFRSSRAPSR